MAKIYQIGKHDALRKTSSEVSIDDIGSKEIKEIISNMKIALDAEEDGVAIAAPQIGIDLRIFVVSKRAFAIEEESDKPDEYQDMVFINPKIKKLSRKKVFMDEGCLSIRGKYGKVKRALKTVVSAIDENGKKFEYGGSGLLSQIFQHEIDHLDGVVFIDKAIEIENT